MEERGPLTEFLLNYLAPQCGERRYDWLYLNNPEGEARVWVATDSNESQFIGVAAAFPRRIYCSGQITQGYVLGDFCIHPNHRSMGPALALQRACLEELSRGEADFVLDLPSNTMLAVYKRLGIETQESMVRFAKPLRVDRKVEEKVPNRIVAHGLSAVVNTGLRLRDSGLKRAADWTITVEDGPWGKEFTDATRNWNRGMGYCVARTADYLNWRYRQHPHQRYEMLTARQPNKLCGFLVSHLNGKDAVIDDLLAEDEATTKALLIEAIAGVRKRQVHTLSVPWLASHSGRRLLEKCGFKARESSSVVLLALPRAAQHQVGHSKREWYLTDGDRES